MPMTRMTCRRTATVLVALAATALTACQTLPLDDPELAAARTAVAQARADDQATGVGATDIASAEQALQGAEAAWKDRDADEARHQAYLARRHAEAALALGQQARFDARTQQAAAEGARLRQEAATREAAARQAELHFASDQAGLTAQARRLAARVAAALQQYPERRVRIEGHADSRGSDAGNLRLSQRRAEAFRQALQKAGVDAARIDVQAYGESRPTADNATAAGRCENRRVELLVSNGEGRFDAAR